MGNIPQLNSLGQLTSILESINPFINGQMQYQQQHQPHGIDPQQMMGNAAGLGGTFFTQDANNGAYYSSNGHTINIQGPNGGNIRVAVNDDGQAYY